MAALGMAHALTAAVLCCLVRASCCDSTIRFMGVAVTPPLRPNIPTAVLTQMFQITPLQQVTDLLQLSSDEVTTLKQDLISYMKDDLGIEVDPQVKNALHLPQPVSIRPQVVESTGSGSPFLAAPATGGVPNAALTPFIRSTQNLPSTLYPYTGNSTIDSDTYDLKEAGYFLTTLTDLNLGSSVGTIPANTSLNSCILTWVGKKNGLGFRIKSTRKIPLPPGPGILFTATGYPSSKFLDLPKGEVQGTYTFVPAPGDSSAIVGRWTTTHSHPTF